VAVIYELKDDEAQQVVAGRVVDLTHERRIGVDGPGCLDCERPYEEARGTPCDAPAIDAQP
jgi:hypothetical protein